VDDVIDGDEVMTCILDSRYSVHEKKYPSGSVSKCRHHLPLGSRLSRAGLLFRFIDSISERKHKPILFSSVDDRCISIGLVSTLHSIGLSFRWLMQLSGVVACLSRST